ncbi:MAG: HEAT repeat domain-containing protein [Cyanobacteriota bacterium]
MKEAEKQQILAQAKTARLKPTLDRGELGGIWRQMHAIAEAQYPPAVDFFISCLDDIDSNWRLEGIRDLGFHYQFPPDSVITQKIRQLLLNDPDDSVRIAAASILGIRSVWPDPVLRTALSTDPNEFVRHAAFDALLTLASVPYRVINREMERVHKREIPPTFEEVKRIITEAGIDIKTLLSRIDD